jgi:hypothetical protein
VDHLYSLLIQENTGNSRVKKFNLAYSGAATIGRALDPQEVTGILISDLHRYVAEFSRRELFIHAGVVGWNNAAILLPGRSFSGKSTLVAELVRAGATYFSDEYAVLDRRGRVHPFPRPLTLRENAGNTRQIPLAELNGRVATKPLPVSAVMLLEFREGARWRTRQLSASKALMGLLSHTVQARSRPQVALSVLKKVVASCVAFQGIRGDAWEAVEVIRATL